MKKKTDSKSVKEIKVYASTGLDLCKRSLTKSIIDLCKETGIDESIDIQFTQLVMLHTTKPKLHKGKFYGFMTETTLCDRITWGEHHDFFHVGLASGYVKSSWYMSIDELNCIYSEMLNVLKKV